MQHRPQCRWDIGTREDAPRTARLATKRALGLLRPGLALGLSLSLIGAFQLHAQTTPTTFSSTSFPLAEWSAGTVPYSSPVAGGTMGFSPLTSGGNPGDFGRMVIQMPPNPPCPTGSWAFAMKPSAVFDPRTSGTITDIDYAWDSRTSPTQTGAGAITLAVEQDGFYWAALNRRLFISASWVSYVLTDLVATDFTYGGSWRQSGQPLNPDFSQNGSPITFGIANGVSVGFGGVSAQCASPPPIGIDTDNWSVTVNSTPPTGPGELDLSATTLSAVETAGSMGLRVDRVGGSNGAVSVDYATVPITATGGADYTSASGTLAFADGVAVQTFEIDLLDDALIEGAETFQVVLSNPTGGATLGASSVVLTINDDEQGNDLAMGVTAQPSYQRFAQGWYADVEITLRVTNRGFGTAADVLVLLDPFAGGIDEYTYLSDDSSGAFAINLLGQWQWTVGTIGPSETRTLRAVFRKTDSTRGAEFELWAEVMQSVAPLEPDPDPSNDRGVTRIPVAGADLSVAMLASREQVTNAGSVFYDAIYDVTVGYVSPTEEPGRNAIFSFTGPGNIISVEPALSPCGVVSGSAGRSYECAISELTEGFALRIRVGVSGSQTVTAEAFVSSDSFDPDVSNDAANASLDIPAPTLGSVVSPTDPDDCDGTALLGYCVCFIATAAYGTPWEDNVVVLRRFREEWLLTNAPGRAFVGFYYRVSPPIADWIREREWARALTRGVLTPIVFSIKHPAAVGLTGASLLTFVGFLWRRRRRSGEGRSVATI